MEQTKPARVVYGKTYDQSRKVRLYSGAKGKGKILFTVDEWPWSSQSRMLTEDLLEQYALDHGYYIVADIKLVDTPTI